MWASVAQGGGNPTIRTAEMPFKWSDVQCVQLGLQRASRPSSAKCDSREFFATIERRQDTRPQYPWLRVDVPKNSLTVGHETFCV